MIKAEWWMLYYGEKSGYSKQRWWWMGRCWRVVLFLVAVMLIAVIRGASSRSREVEKWEANSETGVEEAKQPSRVWLACRIRVGQSQPSTKISISFHHHTNLKPTSPVTTHQVTNLTKLPTSPIYASLCLPIESIMIHALFMLFIISAPVSSWDAN